MKKTKIFIISVMVVSLTMFFLSCKNDSSPTKDESTTKNSTIVLDVTENITLDTTDASTKVADTTSDIPKTENADITNDIGGGELGLLKYRLNYYDVPAPFAEIVESDMFEKWYVEVVSENPSETNVMVMKRFIQDFDISRENFEKANLKWAKIIRDGLDGEPVMNPKDFDNQELEEIYNADIIYTLDDEIINNYYLSREYPYAYSYDFKKAVESGEYVTQTEDWIDVEAMEAEIIAKYGEAEIVTEQETTET